MMLLISLLAGILNVRASLAVTTTPAVGAPTETTFNAALAQTDKTYADNSGESLGYSGELLSTITLARGGAVGFSYSDDGAKDLNAVVWPAMNSGPLTAAAIVQTYSHDRAGRVNAIGDASGVRGLGYVNGRLANTVWTNGALAGYSVNRQRDSIGRDIGVTLSRDDATIHTTAKAPNGVSDQITNLASGNIIATPQRDGAGRITGYIWSDGSNNTVTQTWQRGPGGRIEAATNNVPDAPQFTYLIDPNAPEQSFDPRGRRLKCATSGGTWTYEYGIAGQLAKATHTSLGTFNYYFDAIGRRTVSDDPNSIHPNRNDLLNRTVAWEHDQAKTLTIQAHSDARVWFNGTEIPDFTGTYSYPTTSPGPDGGWVPWHTLAVLEGQGDPGANPDAKAEQQGAVWVPPATESFTYDAAGNRESSAQWDFGWDAKNQLVQARTKNHLTAAEAYDLTFSYDSEGRRFKKHVIRYLNGAIAEEKEITYLWDGWDLIYERHQLPSGMTMLERKYLWGPDIADGAAGGAGGLLLIRETKGNTTTEIIPLYDGTGHVVALTNLNKDLLAEYAYGPFGERIHATGPAAQANPWRYATKYLDEETGLYYFGKRYHDPITGQFLSREPLGEKESLNLYQYGHGDPINNIDRKGLESVPVYRNQIAQAMSRLGWGQYEHERNSRAIDAEYAKWLELFAAAEAVGTKADSRLMDAVAWLHASGHETNDALLSATAAGTSARVDVASAGLKRIYRQASFLEENSDRAPGSIDPAGDPTYFDDENPEFQSDEWTRRLSKFNPGWNIAREAVNGNYGAASKEFAWEVGTWVGLGIAGEFVGTGRVAFGVTRGGMGGAPAGLWQSRLPGVQVRQIGNYWVKRVNPNSPAFMQSWGHTTINQQAGALAKLRAAGRPAANSSFSRTGRLIVEDVGTPISRWNYLNPRYWSARSADAKALGGMSRLFNDLRPGNYGSGFRAFDPALDPAVGALGIGGGAAIGGGIIWWSISEGE